VEGREIRGKSRDYHPAQQTKTGFALSREEANKEDGSELSLGEADKEGEGEAADKRKITPSYHSEKRTKRRKETN